MIGYILVIAAKALLANIWDEKKSTVKHLSSSGGRLCWYNIYDADHANDMFKMTVNDPAERYFE